MKLPKKYSINGIRFFKDIGFNEALEKYESSRQEWEVENWLRRDIENNKYCNYYSIQIDPKTFGESVVVHGCASKGQQVEFVETKPPRDGKRGKCQIVKIL